MSGISMAICPASSDVLSDEKTATTNGITAPAIKACRIGVGMNAASRPVRPRKAVTSTIAPANMAAPASSGNVIRLPNDAKKMRAKTFPGEEQRHSKPDREDEAWEHRE